MKPAIETFSADEVLTHTQMNSIQAAIREVSKCNGNWCGNEPWVAADASTDVTVGPHRGVVIEGVELAPTALTTLPLGTLVDNTWYYLYARNDGSDGVEYDISTTAPDSELVFMNGDESQRYVCSLRSVSTSKVMPFRKVGRKVTYAKTKLATADHGARFTVLSGGSATSFTDVDMSGYIPPHARVAHVEVFVSKSTTAGDVGQVGIRCDGDTAVTTIAESWFLQARVQVNAVQNSDQTYMVVETSSAQVVEYAVDNASTTADIVVAGFEEP